MPLAAARRLGAELRGWRKEQTIAQQPNDPRAFVRELADVADYIQHMRREINALRANEIWRDRLPEAGQELGGVVRTTASATHRIMGAAEDILAIRNVPVEQYRSQVELKLLEILEACSFQDITGQRLNRVAEALSQLERRLNRFAYAVKARDSDDGRDPEELLRKARRDSLLLHGPQDEDGSIAQDEIDKLFS
jgi:chemotaxis protein CheZ